jgi:hypothetical protein
VIPPVGRATERIQVAAAIGAYALEDNTTGDRNTAIGKRDERLSKTS